MKKKIWNSPWKNYSNSIIFHCLKLCLVPCLPYYSPQAKSFTLSCISIELSFLSWHLCWVSVSCCRNLCVNFFRVKKLIFILLLNFRNIILKLLWINILWNVRKLSWLYCMLKTLKIFFYHKNILLGAW